MGVPHIILALLILSNQRFVEFPSFITVPQIKQHFDFLLERLLVSVQLGEDDHQRNKAYEDRPETADCAEYFHCCTPLLFSFAA